MRKCSDLSKFRAAVWGRVRRLRRVHASLIGQDPIKVRAKVGYFVIELDNLVSQALREFVHSALLKARTCSGKRIRTARTFAISSEVSAFIFSVVNEPKYVRIGSPT